MAAQKELRVFGTSTAITITMASLASSVGGKTVNHCALVDNTTVKTGKVRIYVKTKLGAVAGWDSSCFPWGRTESGIYVWAIKANDGTPTIITDNIAKTAATGVTLKSAELIGKIPAPSLAAATVIAGYVEFDNPGPWWAIGIGHDLGAALSSTAGDSVVHYITDDPELQPA